MENVTNKPSAGGAIFARVREKLHALYDWWSPPDTRMSAPEPALGLSHGHSLADEPILKHLPRGPIDLDEVDRVEAHASAESSSRSPSARLSESGAPDERLSILLTETELLIRMLARRNRDTLAQLMLEHHREMLNHMMQWRPDEEQTEAGDLSALESHVIELTHRKRAARFPQMYAKGMPLAERRAASAYWIACRKRDRATIGFEKLASGRSSESKRPARKQAFGGPAGSMRAAIQ